MKKQILIVGAGFTGAVLARELAEKGEYVTIIDKRDHVAGNAYDFTDEYGIRIHKYGPHLFHTNNEEVYNYLSKFTEWIPYQHRVKALYNETFVSFPVNQVTADWVYQEDPNADIVEIFYGRYTRKMWGIEKEKMDPSVLARVPMRLGSAETRYFPDDRFQALPKEGYTVLVKKILDHPLINVVLNCKFEKRFEGEYDHVFNSMPIDEYYDYRFGELPYRSIKFHTKTLPVPKMYGYPVVNFTHDGPHTRITEWKMLPGHGSNQHFTTVTAEEPCDYRDNGMERYYPVKDLDGANRATYDKYKAIENTKTTFVGRTGLYAYLDLHQAINIALQTSKKWVSDGEI